MPEPDTRGALPVFLAALRLGCSAFGGPIAHLGYFERAYVQRLRWIDAEAYASLVALCQMLPGPTSSQVGFLIGWHRCGWRGAAAAWLGFTLPSAILMVLFVRMAPGGGPLAHVLLHGLHLAAVAVVFQAVISMGRSLCFERRRALLAILAAIAVLLGGGAASQLLALIAGLLGGLLWCGDAPPPRLQAEITVGARAASVALASFAGVLFVLGVTGALHPRSLWALADVLYRSGALVFGGGHVVLPLLQSALVPSGWIGESQFLAGYGAAQALPGPLFAIAAFVGAVVAPAGLAMVWSCGALLAIFAPGMLLAVGGFSLFRRLKHIPRAAAALAGVNAAVVGILAAALYEPLGKTAILSPIDLLIAAGAWWLLAKWKLAPLAVIGLVLASCAVVGAVI